MLTSGKKVTGSKRYKSHGDKSLHACNGNVVIEIVCMHDTRERSRCIHVALPVRGFDFWIYYFANIPKNSSLNLKFVRFKCEAEQGTRWCSPGLQHPAYSSTHWHLVSKYLPSPSTCRQCTMCMENVCGLPDSDSTPHPASIHLGLALTRSNSL